MASSKLLLLAETFYSIQGESTFAGLPCVFIRLHGCNLRCAYCDARYSYQEAGTAATLADCFTFAAQYPAALVELTGGEPLLQPGSLALMAGLLAQRRTVLLETNGTLPIHPVPEEVHIIMDVKCPDSGSTALYSDNIAEAIRRNGTRPESVEVKFVLSSLDDYHFARNFLQQNQFPAGTAIHFSPLRGRLPLDTLADLLLQDQLPVRLHTQLHTLIWPGQKRGK